MGDGDEDGEGCRGDTLAVNAEDSSVNQGEK